VPVPAFEGDESCTANPCNGFVAGSTSFREEFAEAIRAVRLIVPGGEPLTGQRLLTVGAGEALPVPRLVAVGHSTLGDHLAALDALGGELVLVALGAVDVVLLRNERLCADGIFAGAADEAFLVPLAGLVLHLLHTCSEYIATSITAGSELGIVTGSTVNPVCLAAELFVDEAASALVAEEAGLVPVLLLVRQILGVDTDNLAALVTIVGEHVLVALDAVRMVLAQYISVAGKAVVTMMAEHDFNLEILGCR